jgi:hypothetical protein
VPKQAIELDAIDEKQLLQYRLCDLPIRIEGTWLKDLIDRLYGELQSRGLAFRPACYLGDEWFSPEGIPVIALPFYLAHPRLIQLERKIIGEAEGENPAEAMRLLRHECGHAIVHAFGLTRRSSWREHFGHPRKPFSDYYRYQPYSKSYVRNLKDFYAQSHPEEDFAETFAVWLDPETNWREAYAGWPALKKLEYIEGLVASLGLKTVAVTKKDFFFHISTLKKKLEFHYRQKRRLYIEHEPDFFDADLKALFPPLEGRAKLAASRFLASQASELETTVSRWSGEKKVLIHNLLNRLKKRCNALKLEVPARGTDAALVQFTAYLTSLVSNYRYTNRYKPVK